MRITQHLFTVLSGRPGTIIFGKAQALAQRISRSLPKTSFKVSRKNLGGLCILGRLAGVYCMAGNVRRFIVGLFRFVVCPM